MSATPRTDAQRHDPVEFYPMGGSGLGQMRKSAEGDWVPAQLAEKLESGLVALSRSTDYTADQLRAAATSILDSCK